MHILPRHQLHFVRISARCLALETTLEISQVAIIQCQVEIAEFQVAVDGIFLDSVDNDVATLKPHRVGDSRGVGTKTLFDLVFFDKPVDQLTAVAAGSAPANAIRFEQDDIVTPFSKVQHRRHAREATADDDNIATLIPRKAREVGDSVRCRGVVGSGMFARARHRLA